MRAHRWHRRQWQDRHASLLKPGNRLVFPKQAQCPARTKTGLQQAAHRRPDAVPAASSSKSSTATSGDAELPAILDKSRTSTSPANSRTTDRPRPRCLLQLFRQRHDHRSPDKPRASASRTTRRPNDDPHLAARSNPFRQWHDHGARTNFGPPATSPPDAPRIARRLVACSDQGNNLPPRRPDTPRATAIVTSRWSRGSLPTSGTSRPRRQPATQTSRPTSGCCHFHRQTDFGRTAPTCPPPTGHKSLPPPLPLLPLPANSGATPR